MENSEGSSQNSKKKPTGKGRGPAFHALDDKLLAESWIAVSEDPVTGTDQTKDSFWNAVKEQGGFTARTPESLRQRWGVISRSVSKFCGVLSTVIKINQSGTTNEDHFDRAMQLYEQDEGKPFKFSGCHEVLSKCPKFKLNIASEKASPSSSSGTSKENPSLQTPTSRPLGRDRSKAAASTEAYEARRTAALERIAAATEQKAQVLGEYSKAIQRQNLLRIATTKLDDLDPISKKILILEKQQVLREMTNLDFGQASLEPTSEDAKDSEFDPYRMFIIEDGGEDDKAEENERENAPEI